ncbi:glutamine amidotransferase [Pseudomonas sp. NPDC089569]|uniref:glutamine amidotransferase n=1 Tax=Pseudomonas sp. NPDC089569 TaxID=3390722 RepID=UPI003D01BE68
MNHPRLLIVQVGTPPEDIRSQLGDLPAWFGNALGVSPDQAHVIRTFEGERLPPPRTDSVAIITGSWSMVTDREPWSEYVAEWIRDAMAIEMPLFGVCYGHQLMAHALGGVVGYHPGGREIGCEIISLLPAAALDEMLSEWPDQFAAHLTHEQTILQLPANAVALARSNHDPHQIVRYGRNAISTQFHPEFTPDHLAALIRRRKTLLISEQRDPAHLLSELRETSYAQGVLCRFVELALMKTVVNPQELTVSSR